MQLVDCRGLSCPQPVLAVKKAVGKYGGEELHILLDPGAPQENVTRFLTSRGFSPLILQDPDCIRIQLRSEIPQEVTTLTLPTTASGKIFLITSDQLGDGPTELGRLLMKNFIISLLEQTTIPDQIFFLNTGIYLTTDGSEVLGALEQLMNTGVEILSCGLCLDYFQKKELLRAGTTTNMFATAEALLQASSVIKL
jgi:selenium metabolism protein YedF